ESVQIRDMRKVRLASYLFPPLGLFYLWRNRDLRWARKLFGTVGILFYSILYIAGIIYLLTLFTPLGVEWRGGFPPVLTFSKTVPDYDAVEAHRAALAARKAAV